MIVEGRYTTEPVHQAYIEPHACLCVVRRRRAVHDLQLQPGPLHGARPTCAKLLGMDISNIRATPAEIGGGFGGKTLVYLEPVALALSKKSGRPVKMQMTREEVFRASGPTSGAAMEVKIGAKKDGTHRRGEARAEVPGRRVPRLADPARLHVRLRHVRPAERRGHRLRRGEQPAEGRGLSRTRRADRVVRGGKRAGRSGAQARAWTRSSCARRTARATAPRRITGRRIRTSASSPRWKRRRRSAHWKTPLKPGQGRGIACGFWFNIGGESSAAVHVAEDGTVVAVSGSPDIGGSRASIGMMVAEVLQIPAEKVRTIVADTSLDRLHPRDRRQPRDLRHRHGGDHGGREGGGAAEAARGDDLGHHRRTRWTGATARRIRPAPTPARSSRCRWPRSR